MRNSVKAAIEEPPNSFLANEELHKYRTYEALTVLVGASFSARQKVRSPSRALKAGGSGIFCIAGAGIA